MLAQIGKGAGMGDKPNVIEAKKWLRDQKEGKKMASLLGALSKVRNGAGHPAANQILTYL